MNGLRVLAFSKSIQVATTAVTVSYASFGAVSLAPSAMATVPIMLLLLAAGLATLPASILMARVGRAKVFSGGLLIGGIGAAISSASFYVGSFPDLCIGCALLGIYQACAQYYRFAAAECVSGKDKANAVLYISGAGLVAALISPVCAIWAENMIPGFVFAGPFALLAAALFANMIPLRYLKIDPLVTSIQGRRAIRIAADAGFIVPAALAAGSYVVMSLVMNAAPVAASVCGFSPATAMHMIQWHLVAMFLPPFVLKYVNMSKTPAALICMGTVAFALSLAVLLLPTSMQSLTIGLIALGVGWSLTYVGATTLLLASIPKQDQAKAQGMNELCVWGASAAASGSSGIVFGLSGWLALVMLAGAILLSMGILFAFRARATSPLPS